MSEGRPGTPNRTIRDSQGDPEQSLNHRDAVVAGELARGQQVVVPSFPRRPLPAGDPASESGAYVSFDELDAELQTRIENQEGFYAAGVQTVQNLRDVPPEARRDRQLRLVEDKGVLYRFDTADTATPDDGDLVLAPTDTNYPNGRWFKAPPQPAPGTTVVSETTFGQTPAVGVVSGYAREDHTHGSPTDPVPAHAAISAAHHARYTDGEADARVATGIANHVAQADPHTQYVLKAGTKSEFFRAPGTAFLGDYAVETVAANGQGRFTFHVPEDFGTLTSVELIGIVSAGAAATARDIDFYTSYAAVGEPHTQHQQSDVTSTYDLSGQSENIYSFDITALFTSLAADDSAGIQVDHNVIGGAIDYLGVHLTYTGA